MVKSIHDPSLGTFADFSNNFWKLIICIRLQYLLDSPDVAYSELSKEV